MEGVLVFVMILNLKFILLENIFTNVTLCIYKPHNLKNLENNERYKF